MDGGVKHGCKNECVPLYEPKRKPGTFVDAQTEGRWDAPRRPCKTL